MKLPSYKRPGLAKPDKLIVPPPPRLLFDLSLIFWFSGPDEEIEIQKTAVNEKYRQVLLDITGCAIKSVLHIIS